MILVAAKKSPFLCWLWEIVENYWWVRYGIVGLLSYALNMLLTVALTSGVGIWYVISLYMADIVADIGNFVGHKIFTFQKITWKGLRLESGKYLMLKLFNIAVGPLIAILFVEWFGLWYPIAQTASIAIIVCWNILALRKWIFK